MDTAPTRDLDLDHFKQKLETEKGRLENELAGLGRRLNDSGDWVAVPDQDLDDAADPLDRAQEVEEFEGRVATLSVLVYHCLPI